ncbi:hypothetical protein CHF27_013560 [Romboutsia maritimum]|uniref:Uncharacterized protein n=1 Tax=Romboutsia maritimum TaxID=2020948 RepID=A0A371IPL7_9FIRM|nr:hypothetical protein [Romboutsia maritimum]RDY22417.1 hypothetical protein CHF27_013560 [Romboutsia maritimum]
MFFIYNWLIEAKSIRHFILKLGLGVLYLMICIFSILGISKILNEFILGSSKNYILISMTNSNYRILIGAMIAIIIVITLYIDTRIYLRNIRIEKDIKIYNLGFTIVLIIFISGLVYCANNYYIFYNDRIEKNNIFGVNKHKYSYKDIQSINKGNKHIRGYKYLYYNINFKNNESVNIVNGLLLQPNETKLVLEIDNIIDKNK